MKNKKIILISILIPFCAIILFFLSCINFKSGDFGESLNIEEAKELGVFLAEYKPNKDSVLISNNEYLTFGDIWIEKVWYEGENCFNRVEYHDRIKNIQKLIFQIPQNKNHIIKEFIQNIKYPIEIVEQSGELFGIHGVGKNMFLVTHPFKTNKDIYIYKILKLVDSSESNVFPNKWTNPLVVDSFYITKQ